MEKNIFKIAGLMLLVLMISFNSCKTMKNSKAAKMRPYIEWASIPSGTFTMGSPLNEFDRAKDEPQHQVTISAFIMSKYEITFDQYDSFCEATGRKKPDDSGWGRGKRPVINVNWYDAQAFAEFMGCRLPTEAEWEYACRAGTTTPFYTGDNLTTSQANYDGTFPYNNNAKGEFRAKTTPVGSFAPNSFGLYDMYGNIWEWCNDWYGDYSTDAQTDPKGVDSGVSKIQRGGCWGTRGPRMRSATRDDVILNGSNNRIGFRLAKSM
jgi:formylglycine-generating enzyme required for sulfatase activity